MSNLRLEVEVDAGSDINSTAKEAIALSKRIGVTVEFDFNGVTCVCNAGGSPEKLASEYQEQLVNDSEYKLAFS
jgi:hypothetical protein